MNITKRTLQRLAAAVTAALATATMALSLTACGDDCRIRQCSDLLSDGSSLSSNDREFEHCITCYDDGTCETVIRDESGEELYSCRDEPGSPCTDAVVDAEFAYCEIQ